MAGTSVTPSGETPAGSPFGGGELPFTTSDQMIDFAVLDANGDGLDDVAYLRFASVYKGFEEAGDFQREAGLLTKTTEPKRK